MQAWNPVQMAQAAAVAQAMDLRKEAALSRLSARLAAGSDHDQVAARVLMGDAEGAALIAGRSADAAAYRLAFMACEASPGTAGCQALTLQGWSRLDPEDARPWLHRLDDAMRRRDDAAATDALEQVLQRHRLSPSRVLVPLIDKARESVDDAVGLGLATIDIVGREAAMPDTSAMGLLRYCSAEALANPARRAGCEWLVRWQFRHADSVLGGLMAVSIADRLGLPADQRPYTRERLNEGLRRLADESAQELGMSCAGIARAADWATLAAQRTELETALQPVPARRASAARR